jgi:hypothetical protein
MSLDLKTLVIIRDAARALIDHATGLARVHFESDRKTRSAILFEIILIGEGIKRLLPDLLGRYPKVPWSEVVGMRSCLTCSADTPKFRGPKSLACVTVLPTRSTPSGSTSSGKSLKCTRPPCSATWTGSSPRRQAADGPQEERPDPGLPWPRGQAAPRHPQPTDPRKLASFARSISPWFVPSPNLPVTNTRAVWFCFGAFLSPPFSSFQFH